MKATINLYSTNKTDLENFLNSFYKKNILIPDNLKWEENFENPLDMVDIIGVYLENTDKFNINLWISIDPEIYININQNNGDKVIRYLYERFP